MAISFHEQVLENEKKQNKKIDSKKIDYSDFFMQGFGSDFDDVEFTGVEYDEEDDCDDDNEICGLCLVVDEDGAVAEPCCQEVGICEPAIGVLDESKCRHCNASLSQYRGIWYKSHYINQEGNPFEWAKPEG